MPGYYACFNAGKIITQQQRCGLGLVWNHKMGTVLQSQSRSDVAAFGTMAARDSSVYESRDLFASVKYKGKEIKASDGIMDLDGGLLEITYALGDHGEKSISFEKDKIIVDVSHEGKFTEYLPLLVTEEDQLSISDQQIMIKNVNGEFMISFKKPVDIIQEQVETDLEMKQCKVIRISTENALHYEVAF